jgi:exopolyphosphatase / guanosine-5'-triphosphate,3'-diphosphate pyrophosphatase
VSAAGHEPARVAAVLDVGSHSLLLLVVVVDGAGRLRVRDEALVTTRLGERLRPGGPLDAAAAARTAAAVVELAGRARAAGATGVSAFATGAVRDAADGATWAAALSAAARVPVEVLSGAREAALAWAAVQAVAASGELPCLAADLGGRTLELSLGHGGRLEAVVSLPLGALVLTEAHLHADPPGADEVQALAAHLDGVLAGVDVVARARDAVLVASGGTATTLAALHLGLARYDALAVHGHRIPAAALASLAGALCARPLAARRALRPVDAGRAAILPAGAVVLARLAAATAAELRVSDRGVRHAYLAERLREAGIVADPGVPWA